MTPVGEYPLKRSREAVAVEAPELVTADASFEAAPEEVAEPVANVVADAPTEPVVEEAPKPKRRGWWSVGR